RSFIFALTNIPCRDIFVYANIFRPWCRPLGLQFTRVVQTFRAAVHPRSADLQVCRKEGYMPTGNTNDVLDAVRERYGAIARTAGALTCGTGGGCCTGADDPISS